MRELLERRVVVERRGEDRARLGEELEAPLGLLRREARLLLASVQARPVDRERHAVGNLLGEFDVGQPVATTGLAEREGDRAHRLVAHDQRDRNGRMWLELRDELEVPVVLDGRAQQPRVELFEDRRLAGPKRPRGRLGGVPGRRILPAERLEDAKLLGPRRGDGDPAHLPVVEKLVHDAPVRERRDRAPGDAAHGRLVVE